MIGYTPPMNAAWIDRIDKDFSRAPYTGWTRAHWMAVLEKMLLGVLRAFKEGQAWPDLPFTTDGTKSPGVGSLAQYGPGEMLGRPMMLAALFIAATGRTRISGFERDIAEVFRSGLKGLVHLGPATTKGNGILYHDSSVGIHLSLVLASEALYEPLDQDTKNLLREHFRLSRFFRGDTNHRLFDLTQAMLLRRMGDAYDMEDADDLLASIMNMYRGDGWFIDGWNQQFDYYNFWGFQLYLHLLTAQGEAVISRYAAALRGITALHEKTFPYWLDADGDLIGRGRSMCYRFAAVCGLQWSQISGLSEMHPGLARRLSSGCIKSFVEHGCLRDDGTMPIGFWGENATVGEDYNSPGGPYWAVTGLMGLLLPEAHPFWAATEEPSPADSATSSRIAVRGAQMTFKTGGPRRESRLYVAGELFRHVGIWESGMKYFQHSYSSKIGFAMAGIHGPEISAGKTGISADGQTWVYRAKPRMLAISRAGCRNEWTPGIFHDGFDGRVVTESFFLEAGELHVFAHFSSCPLFLRIGGWSVRLQNAGQREAPRIEQEEGGMFAVHSGFNSSFLLPLAEASGVAGRVECVVQEPREGFVHTHLFGGIGCWPQWTSAAPVPPGRPVAFFVDAVRSQAEPRTSVPEKGRLLTLARSVRLDTLFE